MKALRRVQPADHTPDAFRAWAGSVIALGRLSDLPDGPGKLLGKEATLTEAVQYLGLIGRAKALRGAAPEEKGRLVEQFVCAEHLLRTDQHPDQGEKLLAGVLEAWPDFGPAVGMKAERLLDRGRLADAIRSAEKAIRTAPEEARGHFVRGRVRLERGHPGAVDDLRKAVELSRERDGRMLLGLALALAETGKADEAKDVVTKAARLLPMDTDVRELLKSLRPDD